MRSHKHNLVASFSYSASPVWTAWRRCGLLVVGIVCFLSLFEAAPLLAQQRSPLDVEEEEEELPGKPAPANQPAGGAPVSPLDMEEEEELPGRAAPMPRPPVGDPLGNPNPLAPAAIPDFGDDDDEANQPEPVCDLLIASLASDGQSRARRIALLPKWLAPPWKPAENYTFSMLNSKGKVSTELRVLGRNIGGIQYYEQRMLRRAADQLQMDPLVLASPLPLNKLLDETPAAGSPFDLASPERQQAAQRAIDLLTTAIGEHDSAVQRRLRTDSAFQSHLRQPLVAALFNLEFSRIRAMYHQQRFAQALAAGDRLLGQPDLGTRGEAAVHAVVERVLLEPAFEAARAADYETCRAQLDEYLTRYPLKPGARAVQLRDGLIAKAEQLVTRAQANNDPKLLDEAAKIWPRLPDLDGMRRQLQNDYPVLHCGYATLPQNFSPLSIQSLPDRHAVSLMFESLVQWVEDERLGPHYSSQLAAARPGPTARGRHFQLPRCVWSDSDRQTRLCTAEDVQATIDLIKRLRPPGYPPAWENLFEELRYDDPFKFSLQLQRDYWQPLSLMDFRILPAHRFPADQRARDVRSLVEAFQQDPVGTGPYRRAADDGESGGTQIRFVANPHYRRPDLPKIREIVFHQLEPVEAVRQLQNRQLHMIFDLSREHLAQLRLQDERIISLRGRSVHFLAPNYRHSPWLQNEAFRRALAHAIDRETILNSVFRPQGAVADHATLTGPYPKYNADGQTCWAYNPAAPAFEPNQAVGHLAQARQQLSGDPPPLRLAYPARHQQSEVACQAIVDQLKAIGITVNPTPIEPHQFHHVVTESHAYDLVYWRHDFEDATYTLWPLFDPSDAESGGGNFMGFVPDEHLRSLFDELRIHKEFREIQATTHEIHDFVNRSAIVIPLWQVDTYVAVRKTVRDTRFDPLNLFQNIETWSVEAD